MAQFSSPTVTSKNAKKPKQQCNLCQTKQSSFQIKAYTDQVILEMSQAKIKLSDTSVITIDGLAASGKSSVAQGVAKALNLPYVSSGLLYRAVTYSALKNLVNLESETQILTLLEQNNLKLEPKIDGNRAFLNDIDISEQCHSSLVDAHVSTVALHQKVRAWVNAQIRSLRTPFVAEGRDMGAVVFTDATVKLFLTASSLVRAKRRSLERPEETERIKSMIDARDAKDAVNSSAASDAIVIDTEHLNLEEVIAASLNAIAAKS
jgi:CMP/dCMP kinase